MRENHFFQRVILAKSKVDGLWSNFNFFESFTFPPGTVYFESNGSCVVLPSNSIKMTARLCLRPFTFDSIDRPLSTLSPISYRSFRQLVFDRPVTAGCVELLIMAFKIVLMRHKLCHFGLVKSSRRIFDKVLSFDQVH